MNTQFQYYGTKVNDITAKGFVTLQSFVEMQMSNNNKLLFERIAQAERDNNFKLKSRLKQENLRAFTPCVVVGKNQDNGHTSNRPDVIGYKDYAHIEKFTGLMVLDFDHLKSHDIDANDLKKELYYRYDCIYAVWVSPSKNGVKAIVKIPVSNTVNVFKEYHEGLIQDIGNVPGLDTTTQNPTLSLFQSYDPNPLVHLDPSTWIKKAIRVNSYDYTITSTAPDIDVTDRDKQTVLKIIGTGFGNIVNDGHPQLRSLSIAIGGYVGSGYITESEAIDLTDYLIESHTYLSKGISNYKKTAHQFIKQGQLRPLSL